MYQEESFYHPIPNQLDLEESTVDTDNQRRNTEERLTGASFHFDQDVPRNLEERLLHRGLTRNGNKDFMNAVLQCLIHTSLPRVFLAQTLNLRAPEYLKYFRMLLLQFTVEENPLDLSLFYDAIAEVPPVRTTYRDLLSRWHDPGNCYVMLMKLLHASELGEHVYENFGFTERPKNPIANLPVTCQHDFVKTEFLIDIRPELEHLDPCCGYHVDLLLSAYGKTKKEFKCHNCQAVCLSEPILDRMPQTLVLRYLRTIEGRRFSRKRVHFDELMPPEYQRNYSLGAYVCLNLRNDPSNETIQNNVREIHASAVICTRGEAVHLKDDMIEPASNYSPYDLARSVSLFFFQKRTLAE